MKQVTNGFYKSVSWRRCRSEYLRLHPLCEECLKEGKYTPASHVHHKIYLNDRNVSDPSISLNFDNLESVCLDCHNKIHKRIYMKRYKVDADGNVTGID